MTRIFISHSHADEVIAYELVDFLIEALGINSREILCTSNPDQGLSYSSSSITDQLKEQLKNSEALIVLITADSLHSAWIPFEAGSFWTTNKPIIPILGPGLTQNDLLGPLKSFLSIPIGVKDVEDRINSATNQIAEKLNLQQDFTKRRNFKLQRFLDALRAWQSTRPVVADLQQENEQLEARIQELEQDLLETRSQLESQQRSHSQELQDQTQELNLRIQQLEQELAKARSQVAQVQKSAVEALRSQEEQFEKKLAQKYNEIIRLREKLVERDLTVEALRSKEERFEKKLAQKDDEIMRLREKLVEQDLAVDTSRSQNQVAQTCLDLKNFSFEVVAVNERGQEIKRKKKQASYFAEKLGNNLTLEMVSIPGGKFIMGTEDREITRLIKKYDYDWYNCEKPQHAVTVPHFFMGRFPITQAQWKEIASLPKIERDLQLDPSSFKGEKRPVEQVSWDNAVEFCQRLSQKTGTEYRLPSEAEWEYAARAGTTTPFYFGDTITTELANYRGADRELSSGKVYPGNYANEPKGKYRERTTVVGIFTPNLFGLYDMHGNVWEWCEDDWHDSYKNAPTNGSAWLSKSSNKKVIRGGSWGGNPFYCRSAFRYLFSRDDRDRSFGFRVVCVAPKSI